jgi:hypothetical protein
MDTAFELGFHFSQISLSVTNLGHRSLNALTVLMVPPVRLATVVVGGEMPSILQARAQNDIHIGLDAQVTLLRTAIGSRHTF